MSENIPGLIEGRVIHYVAQVNDRHGNPTSETRHVVAQIVRVWSKETGTSNLKLNYDGTNDNDLHCYPQDWITSVVYDKDGRVHTWHFIEQA